jgi:hypothetical protein
MVPTENLMKSRIVEDHLIQGRPGGQWSTKGTKVREDVLATDPDSVFPLQAALGYDVTQTLFVGRNTLLVEGPGDILYLRALSEQLRRRKRTSLDARWAICPTGGIDKIQSFVSLFTGAKLNIAVLTDYATTDKRKIDGLRRAQILKSEQIMTFADILSLPEADIEDILDPEIFLNLVNSAYELSGSEALTLPKLIEAAPGIDRLVKRVEAAHRLLPPSVPEFDHFTPADQLIRNPMVLDGDGPAILKTLERAEKVILAINSKLPQR